MTAVRIHTPTDVSQLTQCIADAGATNSRLDIRGGGSKAQVGAPTPDAEILDLIGFAGIVDYDPAELVLTVGAATPLAEIEQLVADERQMLAFEPCDFGPVFGEPVGASTIGGVVATGIAGSRRLTCGSVRDHLLGLEAVSGRGERFVAGAKVVKNVTGYDLPKIMCGSWGRLAALTQLTLKVLPRGRERRTLAVQGLSVTDAIGAMARAMGSQCEVSAAAYRPAASSSDASMTLLRLEGFGPSVTARMRMLQALLASSAPQELPDDQGSEAWQTLTTLAPLTKLQPLWRINVPPSRSASLLAQLAAQGAHYLLDWAGGLIWLHHDGDAQSLRAAVAQCGGHAMLFRAPLAMREKVPALQIAASGVAKLEERVRRAFDPRGVFETGRFHSVQGVVGDAD